VRSSPSLRSPSAKPCVLSRAFPSAQQVDSDAAWPFGGAGFIMPKAWSPGRGANLRELGRRHEWCPYTSFGLWITSSNSRPGARPAPRVGTVAQMIGAMR